MRLAILASVLAASAPAWAEVAQRHAVVVGNNEGGPREARLWFAERDARRVARALLDIGGFPADRVSLVLGQGRAAVLEAIDRAERRIAAAPSRDRSLLVLYYSGHADGSALELGRERLGFEELRQKVSGSAAAVKVVLVDACHSGALTQVKGARALPSLSFPLPTTDSVHGVAYVASTAMGEAAQESAALEGSFFSHHLEAALRGAADADGDGVVTLSEAFRYTASRTVVGTAGTVAGSQHPTFDVKMSGRGDVVLADLRRAEARLLLPSDPSGSYLLRGAQGLLLELSGSFEGLTLGLPAGRYEVQRRAGAQRTGGRLVLARGEMRKLSGLVDLGLEDVGRKGGTTTELVLGPSVVSALLPNAGWALGGRLGAGHVLGPGWLRVTFDGFQKSVVDGVFHYRLRALGGSVAWLRGFRLGPILLEAGPELGGFWVSQVTPEDESWQAPLWSAGAAASASSLVGPFRIGLELGARGLLFPLDRRWTARAAASTGMIIAYGFD